MKTLPDKFAATVTEAVGSTHAATVIEAIETTAPTVSVRANPLKGAAVADGADRVGWEPLGVYLPQRELFAADPAWHQGRYYVQDASSMALGEAVRVIVDKYFDGSPLRYLDACAAPGGKSIAALDSLPAGSLLVANEFDGQRANILAENLAKYGKPDVAVTRGDTKFLAKLGPQFDIIGADVPCSGEGMMRKDDAALAQWSPELVAQCAALQQSILHNLWKALKPGGFLIYSTCTFNQAENEANVAMLMEEYGAESVDLGFERFEGVVPSDADGIFGYRFMPGLVRGEGLFISVLRKPGEDSKHSKNRSISRQKEDAAVAKFARTYLRPDSGYIILGSKFCARPIAHLDLCSALEKHPSPIRIGLPVAELKGKDLAPTHELALSTLLGDVPAAELTYPEALAYLRREMPALPEGLPRGYVTLTYGGYPLGWCKNLGNRANNLLPDYLRLRLDPRNLPDTPPQLPLTFA